MDTLMISAYIMHTLNLTKLTIYSFKNVYFAAQIAKIAKIRKINALFAKITYIWIMDNVNHNQDVCLVNIL